MRGAEDENERMNDGREVVVVTGSSGFIGSAVIEKLARRFTLVGFDCEISPHPPAAVECICIDLTSDESVERAFQRVRTAYGNRIAWLARPMMVQCASVSSNMGVAIQAPAGLEVSHPIATSEGFMISPRSGLPLVGS